MSTSMLRRHLENLRGAKGVDNKQAILAQADPSGRTKLNNEQWQALVALHRALLYDSHDFFLAS